MKAILSNSSQKLLWLEINQNADCSLRKKFIVIYNFRHTCVPYYPALSKITIL